MKATEAMERTTGKEAKDFKSEASKSKDHHASTADDAHHQTPKKRRKVSHGKISLPGSRMAHAMLTAGCLLIHSLPLLPSFCKSLTPQCAGGGTPVLQLVPS